MATRRPTPASAGNLILQGGCEIGCANENTARRRWSGPKSAPTEGRSKGSVLANCSGHYLLFAQPAKVLNSTEATPVRLTWPFMRSATALVNAPRE